MQAHRPAPSSELQQDRQQAATSGDALVGVATRQGKRGSSGAGLSLVVAGGLPRGGTILPGVKVRPVNSETVSREAPPPGSVLGLGGLASATHAQETGRRVMMSSPPATGAEDGTLSGMSPPLRSLQLRDTVLQEEQGKEYSKRCGRSTTAAAAAARRES